MAVATLSDALRRGQQQAGTSSGSLVRGADGTLSQQTTEGVQSLAAKAGLPATPSTPAGVGMIGGTPDQQKMAGTPAAKAASLTPDPQNDLATVMRQQQARTQATGTEQAAIQKSENLQNLGGLGDRVSNFMNVQRQQLAAQAGNTGLSVATSGQVNGVDVSTQKDLLQRLRFDPTNMDLMKQVNQAFGYDISRQLSPQEVAGLYENSVDTIARGAAGSVDDDLTVDDLVRQGGVGMPVDQISSLLGVPAQELSNYSVAQLRDKINQVGQQEMSSSATTAQQATSTTAGQAERGLARQQGRDLSATGVRASESDYAGLAKQISDADKVTFGGRQYSVEQFLSDDNISGIVRDYMQSGPDSDIRRQIDQTEPQLAQFVAKNQAVLTDALTGLQDQAGKFSSIQAANKAHQTVGGVRLDDSIIRQFLPQSLDLSTTEIDPDSVPVLQASRSLPPEKQASYASNLNAEVSRDPGTLEQLSGLDAGTLQSWHIEGGPDSPWEHQYLPAKRQAEALQAAGSDPSRLLGFATGGKVTDVAEAQSGLRDASNYAALGLGSYSSNILDANGDGQIDSPAEIRASLASASPMPSLQAGPGNLPPPYQPVTVPTAPTVTPGQQSLVSKLLPLISGGHIDASRVDQANLSLDELGELHKLQPQWSNYSGTFSSPLAPLLEEKKEDNTRGLIDNMPTTLHSSAEKLDWLHDQLQQQGDDRVSRQTIQAYQQELADQDRQADRSQAEADARARARKRARGISQQSGKAARDVSGGTTNNDQATGFRTNSLSQQLFSNIGAK